MSWYTANCALALATKNQGTPTKKQQKIQKALRRKEKETWHSFGADGINHRTVLVYNLNTSNENLKKVYQIEKKSYFLGMFRFKINPTLHRLFNFTI